MDELAFVDCSITTHMLSYWPLKIFYILKDIFELLKEINNAIQMEVGSVHFNIEQNFFQQQI